MTSTLAENSRYFRQTSETLSSNNDEVRPVKKDNSYRRQNLQDLISGPRHAPLPENYSTNEFKELTFKSKAFTKKADSNGGNRHFHWFIGFGFAALTAGLLYKLLK